jgi:hypothetical protein
MVIEADATESKLAGGFVSGTGDANRELNKRPGTLH